MINGSLPVSDAQDAQNTAPDPRVVTIRDRVLPNWAKILIAIFAISSGLLGLSVSFLPLFFLDSAILSGSADLIMTILGVGAVLLSGSMLLDFIRTQILAGLESEQNRYITIVEACLGLAVAAFLALVHPLLVFGVLFSAVLTTLATFMFMRFFPVDLSDSFDKSEAAAMLSGRDPFGLSLSVLGKSRVPVLFGSVMQLISGFGFLIVFGTGAWLVSEHMISEGGLVAAAFLSLRASRAFADFARLEFDSEVSLFDWLMERRSQERAMPASTSDDDVITDEMAESDGLLVSNLMVHSVEDTSRLVGPLDFKVARGRVLGLTGERSGGKSTVLKALIAGKRANGFHVSGTVLMDGAFLWRWSSRNTGLQAMAVPESPANLPGSGIDNVTAFDEEIDVREAKAALQRIDVMSAHTDRILTTSDARSLSAQETKILALARTFLLRPKLYLLDMPEKDLYPRGLFALADLIRKEKEFGASFVIVSKNRSILDLCDEVIVLESGNINDRGTAEEVLARQDSGCHRIVVEQNPDSEDRLSAWVRSLYTRKGDEENRKTAADLVSDLIAYSCAGSGAAPGQTIFDLRHQVGSTTITMYDHGPMLSTVQIAAVRELKEAPPINSPKRPLWNIVNSSLEFHQEVSGDAEETRVTKVSFEIYDPRLTGDPSLKEAGK